MDIETLSGIEPWEWPEDAGEVILSVLRDRRAAAADRVLAAELGGDIAVVSDEMAGALLSILRRGDEPEDLRGQAAIALGPALEYADTQGFDDPDDTPITERMFQEINESLRTLYRDAGVPTFVRRRILEGSVRAPQKWHEGAVRAAWASEEEDWKLTAVFCMTYVHGFEREIVAALKSPNPDIHYQAVSAASAWSVAAAWKHVAALVADDETEKDLRLAAIDAVASIRPDKADEVLGDLLDSGDEEIVEAAKEAMTMAGVLSGDDDEEDELGD